MTALDVPANPCSSCPYRCDTPAGVWHPDEYRRLHAYDESPGPLAVFLCHHSPTLDRPAVCRGWLGVHDDGIATRLAVARGDLPPWTWPDVTVDLYETSSDAAEAGLVDGPPDDAAARVIERIERRLDRR